VRDWAEVEALGVTCPANQSVNQTGKTMRFCVKVSAGTKASWPAGYLSVMPFE